MPPSTLHYLIQRRLLPPQLKINGGRSAYWLEHEVEAVIDARIAGASNDQVQALVAKLVAERSANLEYNSKNRATTEMVAVHGGGQ